MRPAAAALLLAVATLPAGAADPGPEPLAAAIESFGGQLKATLVGTIESDGLTAAIAVCQEDAPRIAREVGAETGLELRRTAYRVRNPANRPSAADRELLAAIEAQLAAGVAPADVSVYRVAADGSSATLARPIMMAGPCLACHGEKLAPAVAEEIRERYPRDEATGFELGELRGAFVATWRHGP